MYIICKLLILDWYLGYLKELSGHLLYNDANSWLIKHSLKVYEVLLQTICFKYFIRQTIYTNSFLVFGSIDSFTTSNWSTFAERSALSYVLLCWFSSCSSFVLHGLYISEKGISVLKCPIAHDLLCQTIVTLHLFSPKFRGMFGFVLRYTNFFIHAGNFVLLSHFIGQTVYAYI